MLSIFSHYSLDNRHLSSVFTWLQARHTSKTHPPSDLEHFGQECYFTESPPTYIYVYNFPILPKRTIQSFRYQIYKSCLANISHTFKLHQNHSNLVYLLTGEINVVVGSVVVIACVRGFCCGVLGVFCWWRELVWGFLWVHCCCFIQGFLLFAWFCLVFFYWMATQAPATKLTEWAKRLLSTTVDTKCLICECFLRPKNNTLKNPNWLMLQDPE